MDKRELGGPVRWEVKGRGNREMDVGGEHGVFGEEARLNVDTIELDRLGELRARVTEPRTFMKRVLLALNDKNRADRITRAGANVQDFVLAFEIHGRKDETTREETGIKLVLSHEPAGRGMLIRCR